MLRGNLMVGPDDGPLQEAEYAFDRIGVDIATNVFLHAVIDGRMLGVGILDSLVGRILISVDVLRVAGGCLLHKLVKGSLGRLTALLDSHADLAATLDSRENHRLVPFV